MNLSLNQLRNMSFSNVLSYISKCSSGFNDMRDSIKATAKAIKDVDKEWLRGFWGDFKEAFANNKRFMKNASFFKKADDAWTGVLETYSEGTDKAMIKFSQKMSEATSSVKNFADLWKKSCIPTIALFVKYLLIIKGITSGIRNAISVAKLGDTIKDEAQKVHLSTTAYQEWGYVLEQNGTTMDNMKMGMRTFSNNVASGNEALKKYGITATNLDEAFE
jgi:hypothetical protein